MTRTQRRTPRGFTLLEALMAGAIFVIGAVGATSLVVGSSARRGKVSKGASFERLITAEYLKYSQANFDTLVQPVPATTIVTDPDGRQVTFTATVGNDCTDPAQIGGLHTSLTDNQVFSKPGGQLCPLPQLPCANGLCCKPVRLDATWTDTSMAGAPAITETYVAFVTKSCQ